jgi:hypothetical protein
VALEDDRGRTLDVGRKTRVMPPSLRRALLATTGRTATPSTSSLPPARRSTRAACRAPRRRL